MFKTSLILLFALFALSSASECFGQDCQFRSPHIDPSSWNSPQTIAQNLDKQLQRSHWYYLRNSQVLYTAQLETPVRRLFFFYHQSVIGTFLSIVSFNRESGISSLDTMVKVGPGSKAESVGQKLLPKPTDIIFKTKIGEQILELAEHGTDIDVTAEVVEINVNEEKKEDSCASRADIFLKRTYWYYLRGAPIINQRSIITTQRQYQILTYINIVGTFLVVVSCQGEVIKTNTFVRLGAGGVPVPAPQLN